MLPDKSLLTKTLFARKLLSVIFKNNNWYLSVSMHMLMCIRAYNRLLQNAAARNNT